MKSAPVQNSAFVATVYPGYSGLLSSFCALFNSSAATDSCRDTLRYLFAICAACFIVPVCVLGQADSSSQTLSTLKPVDTSQIAIPANVKNLAPYHLTPEQKRKRQWLIGGLNVIGYGTSIVIFNNQWYKNYPKTSFHTFNDSKEWLQMDKLGHAWAAYNSGLASAAMWRWSGVEPKKAAWIGGLSSTVYLTVIEILDAYSADWGWSWADMGANVFGSGLFISQQLGWQEQRIRLKFSFHKKTYDDPMLHERADNLFGAGWTERMLKDYNGQTYWLSANLKSFFPGSNLPAWLNIAVGYGANGMFGGFENKWTDGDPGFPIDRTDINRYRQWYLAPDINFSKFKTNKKGIRFLFDVLDAFKFPAPSLEFSDGKMKVNAIHF